MKITEEVLVKVKLKDPLTDCEYVYEADSIRECISYYKSLFDGDRPYKIIDLINYSSLLDESGNKLCDLRHNIVGIGKTINLKDLINKFNSFYTKIVEIYVYSSKDLDGCLLFEEYKDVKSIDLNIFSTVSYNLRVNCTNNSSNNIKLNKKILSNVIMRTDDNGVKIEFILLI